MAPSHISLTTSDGQVFNLSEKAASKMSMLSAYDTSPEKPINLPVAEIDAETLTKIIDWCEDGEPLKEGEMQAPQSLNQGPSRDPRVQPSAKDNALLDDVNADGLRRYIKAAQFLGMDYFLSVVCTKFADALKSHIPRMTTATITYHELPEAPDGWPADSSSTNLSGILGDQLLQSNYPVEATPTFMDTDEDIKWSHFLQSPFQQSFPGADLLLCPSRRGRLSRGRPSISIPSEELCLVCGDKASGYHYNALTCEGCKVLKNNLDISCFFRRSITRKAVYYCKYGQLCDIDMYMRRKCQHCRLEKCSRIGMRAELVIPEEQCRMKREAKIRKQSVRDGNTIEGHEGSQSPQISSSPSLCLETSQLISRVMSLARRCHAPSDEAMTALSMNSPSSIPSAFRLLAELTILEAQLAHDVIRSLPGFNRLTEDDRRIVQRAAKADLLVLRTAQRYNSATDSIHFGNENFKHVFREREYHLAGLSHASSVFSFARSINKMGLDEHEWALVQAIAAFSERPFISSPVLLDEIQEVYTSALQQYMEHRRPRQRNIFARLIVKMAELKNINRQQLCSPPLDVDSFADVKPRLPIPQLTVNTNAFVTTYPLNSNQYYQHS